MADFTHESNYTEETSFSKVVFGSSAPVLEVELNELQEITDTKLKRIHDIIGKYVYVRGSFNTNSSGYTHQITITDCTVIFNGFSAYVDSIGNKVTTVLGPVNVYFEIIKEGVTGDTTLCKYGNITQGVTIENPIYDSRLGSETSQREQVKIKLRFSSQPLEDTDNTVYIHIGLFTSGVFNKSDYVFDKTIVGLINELSTNKLDTTDFTTNNITGTLPIAKGGTGATGKYDAMANLAYNVVSSSDSTNLNAYTAQTVSVFSSEVPATANLPSGSNGVGMLAVITADRADLSQIWIGMTSGEVSLFTRTRVGGTWSSWEKVYTTQDDLPTANLVVTGIATDVSNSVVFRRAGVTYLTGYVIATPTSTTATTVTLGYVPESYRGTINANVTAYNATENTHHTCTIYPNGSIRVSNVVRTSNSTQLFYLNTMWI